MKALTTFFFKRERYNRTWWTLFWTHGFALLSNWLKLWFQERKVLRSMRADIKFLNKQQRSKDVPPRGGGGGGFKSSFKRDQDIKTEYTRKLINFKFQWTKTLYQNDLKNVAYFLHFSRTKDVILSSVITPKKISHGSLRKRMSNFTRIVKTQVKF